MRARANRRLPAAILLAAVTATAGACSSSGGKATPASVSSTVPSPKSFAVGELTETFVDTHRPTAANGDVPARSDRSLPTVVWYPAQGTPTVKATSNGPPDRTHGPYPLVVFAHGFGSSPQEGEGLALRWAAAGFVVAAPRFPLTNDKTAGGTDAGGYVDQPADMSYVITAMLRESARRGGRLAGLVDARAIGASGHSLGGVTAIGLASNTCCHDDRVKAVIVMSGDTESFPHGRFDAAQAPPTLFVHGDADEAVSYESSVDAFNAARGPKGLLTIHGGDHGSPVDPSGKAFASVARMTTDFFDAYLKHDEAAAGRIGADAVKGLTRVVFEADAGSQVTVPTTPTTLGQVHHASLSADTGLTDGRPVTVQWSGFSPGKSVNVVECSVRTTLDAAACDLKHASLLNPDPSGSGSVTIHIIAGPVGNGVCDASHPNCAIIVNDGGSLAPSASVRIPITFAPG